MSEKTDKDRADELKIEIERIKVEIRRDEAKWQAKLEEAKKKAGNGQ